MSTKQRILFVDDEPMVLEGLKRMLRPLRDQWDMVFAESGQQALELMAQTPFDVVISDMQMPGMNGAQMLNEVMQRYPGTARLILSGHADQDLIMKCVGSAHQYLAKPCDPEALKVAVQRATAAGNALQNETLKKLIAQMDRLPSIPSLYTELVRALQDPEVELEAVGAIVAKDPGMTAKILKLVNSAFFGLARQVSSAQEAVAYLGVDTVKSLVLSFHAFSQFEQVNSGVLSLPELWAHSLDTGAAAKGISKLQRAGAKLADEAFVAGLLHDVGKLVLAVNQPDSYGETVKWALEHKVLHYVAEQELLGTTHAEVGGYLMGLWGLPVPVVEAIAFHHTPKRSASRSFIPLTAVHVADALVHEHKNGPDQMPGSPLDLEYLDEIGTLSQLEIWREGLQSSTLDE